MGVIAVWDCWLPHFFGSLPGCLLRPGKLVFREGTFTLVPAQRPVSEVHGVFSNRDLPSTSGVPPKAIACMFWGVSRIGLAKNSKEGFLCLALDFC